MAKKDEADDLNFCKAFIAQRKKLGISRSKLAEGICTESTIAKIESGDRLPEWYLRSILLSRLGLPCEMYEEYVQPEAYNIWKKQKILISKIENNDIKDFDIYISELKDEFESNKIIMQCLYDIEARVYILKKKDNELISRTYKHAASCLIDIEKYLNNYDIPLSIQEQYVLISYIRYSTDLSVEKKKIVLKRIYEIENSKEIDIINKAKIIPYLTFSLYMIIPEDERKDLNKARQLKDMLIKSLELLGRAGRAYYILELLDCMCEVKKILNNSDISKFVELRNALEDSYELYEIEYNMLIHPYIYNESYVYSIGDVIKRRRQTLNMTKKELAADICDEKTITRIENSRTNIQRPIMRELFKRLGMSTEFMRGDVVATDAIYNEKIARIEETIDQIKEINYLNSKVDSSNPINRQTMLRLYAIFSYKNEKISKDRYVDLLEKALEQTIEKEYAIKENNFLSRYEMICIYNLACALKNQDNVYYEYLQNFYCMMQYDEACTELSIYALVVFFIASLYGDNAEYEESNNLADRLATYDLRKNRLYEVHKCIYNNIWNKKAAGKTLDDNDKRNLKNSLILANFLGDKEDAMVIKEFLRENLK